MKHYALLTISCILALGVVGCKKDPITGNASKKGFTGETVTVGETRDSFKNLYILSEGSMGRNEASLDFFTPSEGLYVRNAFLQANPSITLGDTANDIIAVGDEIWIALNGSDLIEVLDANTLAHKTTITIPTPRYMFNDFGDYVYVTSYNGAYTVYSYNPDLGYSEITDYKNPRGVVYKIDPKDHHIASLVQVGYQPEGVALGNEKLYAANSGGISSQLPPDYAYDNTISVIDRSTMKVTETLTGQYNAKELFSTSEGILWEHCLGDYGSVHSGLYKITSSGPKRVTAEGCELCVSVIAQHKDAFWIIGSDDEFNWEKPDKTWYVYKISDGVATKVDVDIQAKYPYGIAVDPETEDLYITDGGTGGELGTVYCYSKADNYSLKWKTISGIFPGHFLFR